ncbi:M4 family metallopeptidase [Nocardioides korecus]
MKQAPLGTVRRRTRLLRSTSVLAVGALALTPLAVGQSAQAARPTTARPGVVGTAPHGGGRPDPTYTPAKRRSDLAAADRDRAGTAKRLRLGSAERLVARDALRDVDGTEHVRYQRTYDGLPVIGGDLVVSSTPTGKTQVVRAQQAPITVPTTNASVAGGTARSDAARRSDLRAGAAAPVKVVYAVQHRPVLAWQSEVVGTAKDGTPVRDLVYTDARTGDQLGRLPQVMDASGTGQSLYSGSVPLQTVLSGSTYQLTDSTRGGHSTYDAGNTTSTAKGTLFTDADNAWGTGTTSSRQSAAVDAAYGAAETWDMYKAHFGRTGIRNDGVAAYSRVHYGTSYENAFWDDSCFCMTYGDGGSTFNPLTSLDVAGHEMSHGVTAATDGLVYTGDAGGLNESTSDVFGTMVEFEANSASDPGDYYIGEKIAKDGTYLRRMDDPSLDGGSKNCWTSSVGSLDPHYSSGVGNHLFYLLAEGTGTKTIGGRTHGATTCNGTTLTGIGRDTAAAIWYRAMTTYWTSTTTYPQAANGQVKAAKDLYGATSSQCTATVAAWKGVAVTPTETCGTTTPPPTSGNLVLNPGFESGATGWTQTSGVITNATGATPHAGSYYAWLDGYGAAHTDSVAQSVTIPAASTATLGFYLRIASDETTTSTAYDTLKVQVTPSGGATTTLATYSNLNKGTGYVARSVNLSAYAGKTVTVKFLGVEDSSAATSFLLDDVSVTTG